MPTDGSTARVAPLVPLPRLRDSLPPEYLTVSVVHPPRVYRAASYLSCSCTDLSVTLPPSLAIRFSRSTRHSVALSPSSSGDSRVCISPTRSPLLFRLPSSLPRCPSLLLLIASMYLLCVYLSFFLPRSLFLPFSRCFRPSRARKPRNSVEYARRRAFDTLCSVSEGSVRRFHGEAPFSTRAAARAFSLFLTHGNALAPCLLARQ